MSTFCRQALATGRNVSVNALGERTSMSWPRTQFAVGSLLLLSTLVVRAAEPGPEEGYRVLAGDKGHVALVNPKGEVQWETPTKAEVHELGLLPEGNVLFLFNPGKVVEVNREKQVVWEYEGKPANPKVSRVEIHAFQRLDNGITMIAESGNGRIVEVDKAGKIVHE